MKVIIVGAGEVGKGLASTLCLEDNDVVVVDQNEQLLQDLSESLDIMTCSGNAATPNLLDRIGVSDAQLLVAVTHSTEVNVLSCQIAKSFNPNIRTISRISDPQFFPRETEFESSSIGVDHVVVPQVECSKAIMETVKHHSLKELITLSIPGAVIAGFQVSPGSPMIGRQLFDFPRRDLLEKTRICAIWRRGTLIIPRGKERFNNYDEIYVAGKRKHVDKLIQWATLDDKKISNVVIYGAGRLGLALAQEVNRIPGMNLKIIEPDLAIAEEAMDFIGSKVPILNGDATGSEVLDEAGVDAADAFVSALSSDESNVLASLLAKRKGADKVIAVVNKPDYREIIATMDPIDCCFSPRIAALNTIINLIKGSERRIGALPHRINAEIYEMTVTPKSKIAGKAIKDCPCPDSAVFAMILRGNVVVPAIGNEIFQIGDRVVMMGTAKALKEAEKLYLKRSIF